MTTLLENPLPIAVVGGLVATLALVVFLSRRSCGVARRLGGVIGVDAAAAARRASWS